MTKKIVFLIFPGNGKSGFINLNQSKINDHILSFGFGLNQNGYLTYHLSWPKIIFFPFLYLKYKPEFIIITPHPRSILVLIWKLFGFLHKKYFVYWDDFYTEMMGKNYPVSLISFIEFLNIKKSDFIFTPSKYLKNIAENIDKRALFLPHGVNIKTFKSVKAAHLPSNIFKVVYVGSINHYKRSSKLFDLAKKNPSVRFYIIGHVENSIKFKPLENMFFLGYLPSTKFYSYVKACDLALITADQDSTIKMYFYIGLGVPILALNGRSAYVLKNNYTGIISDDLNEGLKFSLNNPKVLKHIKQNYKKFKLFDWKELAKMVVNKIKLIRK